MQDRICQVDETSCNARPDHTYASGDGPWLGHLERMADRAYAA
jgi:hypothetical protein